MYPWTKVLQKKIRGVAVDGCHGDDNDKSQLFSQLILSVALLRLTSYALSRDT